MPTPAEELRKEQILEARGVSVSDMYRERLREIEREQQLKQERDDKAKRDSKGGK